MHEHSIEHARTRFVEQTSSDGQNADGMVVATYSHDKDARDTLRAVACTPMRNESKSNKQKT